MSITTLTTVLSSSKEPTFEEKVLALLQQQKRSKAWLAEEIGVSKQALNYMLKHSVKPGYIAEIALALNVSVEWLKGETESLLIPVHKTAEGRTIPVYELKDLASIEVKQIGSDRSVIIEAEQPKNCIAVYLDNISMEPIFKKGTILIFDQDKKPVSEDYVLLKRKDKQDVLFRQMVVEGKDTYYKSSDVSYKPLVGEEVEIIGVLTESRYLF